MRNILEMKQRRAQLVKDARALIEAADAEKRSLTTEEEQQYDRIMADVDKQGAEIEREERQQRLEEELRGSEGRFAGGQEPPTGGKEERKNPRETEEYRKAFGRYIRGGQQALTDADYRAMQADVDTSGGFIVTPQQFVNQLIKSVNDSVFIRQLATVHTLDKAQSLGVPTLDADPSDADWTSEVDTGQETDISLGKRELSPHPTAKLIRVSNKLIRAGGIDAEQLVRDRLAYKFSITQEKAFMTGNGAQQPLGVFTASANGISNARDVATGNTATAIGPDGLIEAKYELKAQYQKSAQWLFHRDAVKQIRKIKDADGNYIWKAGLSDKPDTILDIPYFMSEYAPNTFTTGKYVGIIGDFSFYWIADALDMQIQRLVELYARTNQVGFIGRMESDGMPVLAEAFARVTLA